MAQQTKKVAPNKAKNRPKPPPKPRELIERTAVIILDNDDGIHNSVGLVHPFKTFKSAPFSLEKANSLGRARIMRMRLSDGTTVLPWINWQTGRTDVDVPAKGKCLGKIEIFPMPEVDNEEAVIGKINFTNGFSVTTTAKRLHTSEDKPEQVRFEFQYHLKDDGLAKLSYFDNGKWTGFDALEVKPEEPEKKN